MKEVFVPKVFSLAHRGVIRQANEIISEYRKQGFRTLTVRQIYYQFVARDYIPNTLQSYKRLASILNDARLAGFIDWEAIGDNTRNLVTPPSWDNPQSIMDGAAHSFRMDPWEKQNVRFEVWIEKDALTGVIQPICRELRVPYFACRGYTSQSEAHDAGKRLGEYAQSGQRVIVLHLGDHDPSGVQMSEDNRNRLGMFGQFYDEDAFEFRRIALTREQVEQYDPPSNPAKLTDSRSGVRKDGSYIEGSYCDLYGEESWELDALSPSVIADLIRVEIEAEIDPDPWEEVMEEERLARDLLAGVRDNWASIALRPWEKKTPEDMREEAADLGEGYGLTEFGADEIRRINVYKDGRDPEESDDA